MPTIAPVAVAAAWQRHRRLALAKGLERVVAEADRPYVPSTASAAVPVDRHAVRESRTSLLELAAAVRSADDARPADLLLVRRLLIDIEGPLYLPASPAELRSAAVVARDAIEGVR